MVHYEVVWPSGDLLGIFPSYGEALRRAWFYRNRGYWCRVRSCVRYLGPSALTMAAAVRKLRRELML